MTGSCYDLLFNLPAGASRAALSDVDSVLFLFDFADDESPFFPETLADYLLSPDRSHDMFQSEQATHLGITLAKAQLIQKWAELSWSPDQEWDPEPTKAWKFHFDIAMSKKLSIPAALLQFDLRLVWRYMYCYNRTSFKRNGAMDVLSPFHNIHLQHVRGIFFHTNIPAANIYLSSAQTRHAPGAEF